MAHDVFIGYSTKDKAVADAVCATLEAKRVRCWIAPRDAQGGVPYAEPIVDAINESRVMILVLSSNSNDSPQVMREVERAATAGAAVIPFRIEDVLPSKSLQYFIGPVHWLDALTPPLEQRLNRLAETVRLLLERLGPGLHAAPGAGQPALASRAAPDGSAKAAQALPTRSLGPGIRYLGVVAIGVLILFGFYEGILARYVAPRPQPVPLVAPDPAKPSVPGIPGPRPMPSPAGPTPGGSRPPTGTPQPTGEMAAYRATHTIIPPSTYTGLWDARMGTYRCRTQNLPDGRYRFSSSCPPPLSDETGAVMMATHGTWRLWADTGRRDEGRFRVLGPDRTEMTGLMGTVVWVRAGAH